MLTRCCCGTLIGIARAEKYDALVVQRGCRSKLGPVMESPWSAAICEPVSCRFDWCAGRNG
jgi:hypothetical protein